jgi:hypothetical protein
MRRCVSLLLSTPLVTASGQATAPNVAGWEGSCRSNYSPTEFNSRVFIPLL